jgi:hypothetical protein
MGGTSDVSAMGTETYSSKPSFSEPTFYDIPGFDVAVETVEEEADQRGEASGALKVGKTRQPKARKGKTKITSGRRVRYDDEKITKKWWFWTAAGAVIVGGGTAAAVVALSDDGSGSDEPIDETGSERCLVDRWTLVWPR